MQTLKTYSLLILTIVLLGFYLSDKLVSQTLPPKEFKKSLAKNKGILIDVRTPEEYRSEKIKGAININVQDTIFKTEIEKLDRNKSYFLYCRTGKRSAKALEIMKESNFKKVYTLEKGIEEWKNKGFPTEKGN